MQRRQLGLLRHDVDQLMLVLITRVDAVAVLDLLLLGHLLLLKRRRQSAVLIFAANGLHKPLVDRLVKLR
jgi:hypothetical protein